MKKKIIFVAGVVAVLLIIFVAFELLQAGRWRDNAFAVVVLLLLLVFQFYSFARMKPVKNARELGDDDGGIDWREKDVADPEPQMRGGWVVLTSWCEVFEAKGLAARLEAAGLRCRVEISNDKPTDYVNEEPVFPNCKYIEIPKMCVLVAPSDYDAAKKLLSPMEE